MYIYMEFILLNFIDSIIVSFCKANKIVYLSPQGDTVFDGFCLFVCLSVYLSTNLRKKS